MPCMSENALILELLRNIRWAIDQIQHRSKTIETYEDFLADDSGQGVSLQRVG